VTFTRADNPLGLRPISTSDIDAIMAWINDPEVTRNFAHMSGEITREQELAWLEEVIASPTDRLYAVVDEHGAYLGNAGIHKIYWPARNGRLGLVLGAPGSRSRGLGTHAMRLLTEIAFSELGLHKVWMVHYRSNARMAHLATKLGFTEEGVLRDEYFHGGAFHDMIRWSLLEDDPR
jgi:RimJ/RimL family protein N-acetyltransferase